MGARLKVGFLALGGIVQREDNRLAVCESEFDSRYLHKGQTQMLWRLTIAEGGCGLRSGRRARAEHCVICLLVSTFGERRRASHLEGRPSG